MAGLNSKFSKERKQRAADYNPLCTACCENYRQQIEAAQGKKEFEKARM